MVSVKKIFIYKFIIVVAMILFFAILYKILLGKRYNWLEVFFTSFMTQSFTSNPIKDSVILIPNIIQNFTSFILVIGVFATILGHKSTERSVERTSNSC
jgi:hypothetical protein